MLRPDYIPASETQRNHRLEPGALADRVVVVTGATGGLGTALCRALGAAGATLALLGRDESKLDKLHDALVAGGAAPPLIVPFAQERAGETEHAELAAGLHETLGAIDALVHASAAFVAPMPMATIGQAEWARVFAVNLGAARLTTLACLPHLEASSLASVTFLLDDRGGAYWGPYGVSKRAVHALMQMLADEREGRRDACGHPRLAINGYDPGAMRTPLRRRAFPGELERETPPPDARLGPLLALIAREDRSLNGAAIHHEGESAA